MNTIKVEKKNTLMVAHRGVSGLETENTIPAFVAAGNRSYYGIETDIHVTKDGKFLAFHDDDTARVANGDTLIIEQSSYELLRKVVLNNLCPQGTKEGKRFGELLGRDDLLIPRMEDYINICKKYEKKAVLEVKNHMEPDVLERMVKEIQALDYLDEVIFISFDLENLITLRNLLPNQTLQYLTYKYHDEVHDALVRYKLDWDVWEEILTKDLIETLHAEGVKINCYTVDEKERAEELISWGIDFITSNILE